MSPLKDMYCLDLDGEDSRYVFAESICEAVTIYKAYAVALLVEDGEEGVSQADVADPIAIYLVAYGDQVLGM